MPACSVQALPVEQVGEHGGAGDDSVLDQPRLEGHERVEEEPRADPVLRVGHQLVGGKFKSGYYYTSSERQHLKPGLAVHQRPL